MMTKRCNNKTKFYKSGGDANKTLQDALKLMLNNLIKSKGLHKVNIICDEKISLSLLQT